MTTILLVVLAVGIVIGLPIAVVLGLASVRAFSTKADCLCRC